LFIWTEFSKTHLADCVASIIGCTFGVRTNAFIVDRALIAHIWSREEEIWTGSFHC
jgi:hypothetical protein